MFELEKLTNQCKGGDLAQKNVPLVLSVVAEVFIPSRFYRAQTQTVRFPPDGWVCPAASYSQAEETYFPWTLSCNEIKLIKPKWTHFIGLSWHNPSLCRHCSLSTLDFRVNPYQLKVVFLQKCPGNVRTLHSNLGGNIYNYTYMKLWHNEDEHDFSSKLIETHPVGNLVSTVWLDPCDSADCGDSVSPYHSQSVWGDDLVSKQSFISPHTVHLNYISVNIPASLYSSSEI